MKSSMQWAEGADRHAEVAYEQIAPVYDDFTAHHNYPEWIDALLKLGAAHGLRGDAVLDVGCGTGKGFMPLVELGWKVTAADISPSMVELARTKAGPAVRIEVADMRELPLYGSFDLVLCLDDAINYLHSADELERALRGMAANLAPDGLLIFDSNTLTTYRTFVRRTHRGRGARAANDLAGPDRRRRRAGADQRVGLRGRAAGAGDRTPVPPRGPPPTPPP
jgi:SAM-dependent methyltransferase